jgi:hypothetical protein
LQQFLGSLVKTNKHTFFAVFFTLLIVSVSITSFLKSDLYDKAEEFNIPVQTGLFYNMQLPFTHGAMLTDRVEQVIINQYSESSKTLHQFNYSYIREIRNLRKSVQYISELSQKKLSLYSILNCVLRK